MFVTLVIESVGVRDDGEDRESPPSLGKALAVVCVRTCTCLAADADAEPNPAADTPTRRW